MEQFQRNKKRKNTLRISEAIVRRRSVKMERNEKTEWKTAQVPAQVFFCEICDICKNTNILLSTTSCFLQVNHKRYGMVSTNN